MFVIDKLPEELRRYVDIVSVESLMDNSIVYRLTYKKGNTDLSFIISFDMEDLTSLDKSTQIEDTIVYNFMESFNENNKI